MQLRGEGNRFFDRAERDISEVQYHICRADGLVPPLDELSVHLVDRRERAFRKLADPGVAEMGVRRDEVDLVEVKPPIFAHSTRSLAAGGRLAESSGVDGFGRPG